MTATAMQMLACALLVTLCHPGAAAAQERFPRVQYLAGRSELVRPTEVTLVLDDRELRAEQTVYLDRGPAVRTAFIIPLMNIIAVGASPRDEAGGFVLTDPAGVSSSLNREEYVTLTLRSGDRIEAVLFKVERQQSAGIAAKIESAADRALEVPISRPQKAHTVRPRRRPLRLVKIVARPAASPRDGLRKSPARRSWRGAADHRHIERT
jgi:hypothetical protein